MLWRNQKEMALLNRPSRALLARLLLAVDYPVHVDLTIDAVYGSAPPRSARNQIQKCVSELRAQGVEIIERAGTYSVNLPAGALDTQRFTTLVHRAHTITAPDRRALTLRRADSVWRGPAFAGLQESVFRSAAAEWDEKRLMALTERIEAEMLCHRFHEVVPELRRLLLENPLNESLHALFMVACVQTGRVSEAIRCYTALRYRLADELGIDPPGMLQALHQMILQQEPELLQIIALDQIESLASVASRH
ncbi:AfsR/SARP family transcriptional regulator [Kineosporia sp. J2-2]|uniref:AfsR/SARP family transcriptional regulator n=1 Tax=Kineosporia corallincola TaxID=2835133 RepID=A0ABS5TQ70_9ACTN|nr:AfsR/SARP family transcriptional regulator [Kineosporia corallincola]MBT0772973.1 AfsR/SARP family transcriptional regulator [Kineosporia corallincola]